MTHAFLFLVDALVSFFTLLFLARFFMQLFRVSFSSQLGGFVTQLTNWAVKPLRRLIPGFAGYDWASLLPAYGLQVFLAALLLTLRTGIDWEPGQLAALVAWHGLIGLLRSAIHLLVGVLILQAVLSWTNPHAPVAWTLQQLTRPWLAPIQRVLPPISGIDLSPLVLILLAQLVLSFLG
ncbi:MAG: hypothetical protein RIR00_899 [Pseudomonadota bacterium]|jgi:YggT family protein